jgi:hypothetical protein
VGRKKATADVPTEPLPPLRLVYLKPSDLIANQMNWRTHPETQSVALSDVVSEVGWAGACLLNERTGRLIDGHLRKRIGIERGDKPIPVLVGRWTEEQERKILATLDPLSALAVADSGKLDALLASISTDSPAVRALLDVLKTPEGVDPEPPTGFPVVNESIETESECPKCGYRFSGGKKVAGGEAGEGVTG